MKKIITLLLAFSCLQAFSQIQLLYDFSGVVDGAPALNDSKKTFIFNDYLYFPAYAGFGEIWRTDGSIIEPLRSSSSSFSRFFMQNPKYTVTSLTGDTVLSFVATAGTAGSGASGNTYLASGRGIGTLFSANGTLTNSVNGLITNVGNDIFYVDNNVIRKIGETGNNFSYNTPLNNNGFSDYRSLFAFNDKIYFGAENINSGLGIELYELDLNTNSFRLISDLASGSASGDPGNFFEINGKIYFSAKTAANPAPYSLFVYNPSTDTVSQIPNTVTPEDITTYTVGTNTFLMLSAEVNGVRRLVRVLTSNDSSIVMSTNISEPEDLIAYNGNIYFGAVGANGKELYKSNQIPGSEVLVTDIYAGVNSSSPRSFMEFNGELFFRAIDATHGQELWKMDASENVSLVEDFVTGTGNFAPIPIAVFKDKLYMSAIVASSNERELFIYTPNTTFTGTNSNYWDDVSNWSNGLPNSTKNAIIPSGKNVLVGDYTQSQFVTNAVCLDLTIEGSLTVDAGSSLTIEGNIDQINGGTVTVNSEYSKIPSNNKTGTLLLQGSQNGDLVTFNRSVRGESVGNDHNWSLISLALRDIDLGALISNNNFASGTGNNISLAQYDNTNTGSGWVYADGLGTGNFAGDAIGLSYSPGTTSLSTIFTYSGKLWFQDEATTVGLGTNNNNWNLVGNPFLGFMPLNNAANSTNNILLENDALLETGFKAAYIWDSTLNNDNGGYKIINQSTPLAESFLAPGQGFFVRVATNGSFNFSRDLRTHQPNNLFYKTANQPKIELIVSQDTKVNSTEIKYLSNTSLGLDDGFDAGKFNGEIEEVSIYTEIPQSTQNLKLGLQCVPQDYENVVIPIGVKVAAGQQINITAQATDLPSGIMVFLEDKQENTFTRIDNDVYSTTSSVAIDGVGRYFLYTSSQALSTEEFDNDNISVFQQDNMLKVKGIIDDFSVSVYNVIGKSILERGKGKNGEIALPPSIKAGVYIVKIETDSKSISKKIILK